MQQQQLTVTAARPPAPPVSLTHDAKILATSYVARDVDDDDHPYLVAYDKVL